MGNKSYSEKLKDPRWQKKRLFILERDGWECQLCGDTKTSFHVHHKKYTGYNPWNAKDEDLISYCEHCHNLVTYFDTIDGCQFIKVIRYSHETDENRFFFLVRLNGPTNPVISVFEYIDGKYILNTHLFKDQWFGILELAKLGLNG
jgi:hypothetical protein